MAGGQDLRQMRAAAVRTMPSLVSAGEAGVVGTDNTKSARTVPGVSRFTSGDKQLA